MEGKESSPAPFAPSHGCQPAALLGPDCAARPQANPSRPRKRPPVCPRSSRKGAFRAEWLHPVDVGAAGKPARVPYGVQEFACLRWSHGRLWHRRPQVVPFFLSPSSGTLVGAVTVNEPRASLQWGGPRLRSGEGRPIRVQKGAALGLAQDREVRAPTPIILFGHQVLRVEE